MTFQTAPACASFVEDISAFVDDELSTVAVGGLVDHVHACTGCHGYLETLRKMSALHRQTTAGLDDALAAQVDPKGLFSSITSHLVDEKRGTLGRLFYEIGKAYVLAGNRALGERRRHSVAVHSRVVDIRGTEARARRELRQAEQLGQAPETPVRGSQLFRRSRQLFGSRPTGSPVSGALTRGRRFLEEALALDSSLDEARLYLGFHHAVVGRPDRARLQLRKVYLRARDPLHRLMAVQALGKLHADEGDFRRAIDCYEEVVSHGGAASVPSLFPSFLNLPVNYAKAGRRDDTVRLFSTLVGRFPERVAQIRGLLARKRDFLSMLERDTALHRDLAAAVPALFAA